ncbi:hypothetical protein [Bradyrhizobium sp. ORS 111]|uniref:hypothetical protein n=1 Tax=Bradyrhizobium sp. ORS 111 TaxID=1685958 RepID=UPI00388DCA24
MAQRHAGAESAEAHTTTDHSAIRHWIEVRNGRPATVEASREDGHVGILRVDFDPPDAGLEQIGWDEFFRKFDDAELAFLYQDHTKDGKTSRFHKFIRRSDAR